MALGVGGVNYHWQGVIIYRPLGFLWIFLHRWVSNMPGVTSQATVSGLWSCPFLPNSPPQKPGAWSLDHPGAEVVRLCHRNTWMSQDVGINGDWINGLFHLLVHGLWYIYWGYNPNWLTIDPNFRPTGHPSGRKFSSQVGFLFRVFFLVGRFWWIIKPPISLNKAWFLGWGPLDSHKSKEPMVCQERKFVI